MLEHSEIESNRFGLNIYRGSNSKIDVEEIISVINHSDIVIIRYPTETIDTHYKLHCLNNCRVIHADSLVYYKVDLTKIQYKSLKNNTFEYNDVNDNNIELLDTFIPIVFNNYKNHYFTNPFLDKTSIIRGYTEWAKSYAISEMCKDSWIVKNPISDDIIAFASCRYDNMKSESEGILYGVSPLYSGIGVYTDLIRFTQNFYKRLGISEMWVSTQLQNYRVQKAWINEGFKIDKSFETYHIINTNRLNMNRLNIYMGGGKIDIISNSSPKWLQYYIAA